MHDERHDDRTPRSGNADQLAEPFPRWGHILIYARHAESVDHRGWYGTCKVDRTGDSNVYHGPNFINLRDHRSLDYRKTVFVQVNTLVNL